MLAYSKLTVHIKVCILTQACFSNHECFCRVYMDKQYYCSVTLTGVETGM